MKPTPQSLLQEESLQFVSLWTQITEEAPGVAEGLDLATDAEILAFVNGNERERAYISMIGGQSLVQMASCMYSGMMALPNIARHASVELQPFYENDLKILNDCTLTVVVFAGSFVDDRQPEKLL